MEMTIQEVFEKCGMTDHPGYESFYYHPDPGCSDYAWWRFDANMGFPEGIQLFDTYCWTPLPNCAGYTVEEQEVLASQIPEAMPLNDLQVGPLVKTLLPGVVQDILAGRFTSIAHARNDSLEPDE